MREGRLGYNSYNKRYGLLSSDLWIDTGFHCGECLEVLVDDQWVKTRMEMNPAREWYLVDQHIIICRFRRIKLRRNNTGIFHPRTPGTLVITVIEKIVTVITRLKMGYFNFPNSANYGIK